VSQAPPSTSERGPDWVRDAVFYQVFPDRFHDGDPANDPALKADWDADQPTRDNFFGGDLAGITAKLSHLDRVGVNALYMTPIFAARTNHRYDAIDYFEIDPKVGDTGALRELVQEAHGRGIRVLLDGVFNHVGDNFWAFRDVVERGADSAYRDWFFSHGFPVNPDPPNYQTCGGTPYLPKLNTANPDLREHLLRVATHWIQEAGIDGWRLDVPWKVPLDFWRDFRQAVKERHPDSYLVGEAWWSWGAMRSVFDGLMNYRLRARLFDFCLFDSMDAEDFAIELAMLLAESDGGDLMLNLLGSHDTARLMTVAGGDQARVALALCALFTLPGTPMIYYGDEIGLEGDDDPDCRRPMPWNESKWRMPILELTQKLIALRREHGALRRGTFDVLLTFNRVIVYRRKHGDDDVIVVLNPGATRSNFEIALPADVGDALRDAWTGTHYSAANSVLVLPTLPSQSTLILTATGSRAPGPRPGADAAAVS
jgi:glycosidase